MRHFEKGEWKLLWPFYLDHLFSPMLFFMPLFMLLYFTGIGLSTFQYGILMAVYFAATVLFEIPTGVIADLYGRKFSVILGCVLAGLGNLLFLFTHNFYLLLLIMAFVGFSNTLPSGAKEAWVADLIKSKRKNFFHSYLTKAQSIDLLGIFISGFLGAFLVKQFGISIIWPAVAMAYFISIPFFLIAEESFKKKKTTVQEHFKEVYTQAKTSINYSYDHPVLFYFIFAGMAFAFAASFGTDIGWVPLLHSVNFPDYALGYLWSGMALVGAIAPFIGKLFYKKGNEKIFLITFLSLEAVMTLLVVFAHSMTAAIFIFLSTTFLLQARRPTERSYFHTFIANKLRATIGSIESMILSFTGIIGLPLAGLAVDKLGAQWTIFLSGVLMIPAVFLYLKIKEPVKNKT